MRTRSSLLGGATAVSLLVTVALALPAATPAAAQPGAAQPAPEEQPGAAQPAPEEQAPTREFGNGPERNTEEAQEEAARALRGPAQPPPISPDRGYPRQLTLPEPPADPADRSIKLGLAAYHELAPTLNDLQQRSDRVSVEIAGQSVAGRDIYLVTLTEPESRGQAQQQERMRQRIQSQPAKAARDQNLLRSYKAPVFINNNIHGDEWEGTDASLRLIEELATSTDPEVRELLRTTRLYFNLTANPDGRVAGTRANAAGFDLNRDFVTASQPEVRAIRQIMIDTQSLVMLDMHGYVNGTLLEPATPPHGQNYEYDIYIKHTYANAVGMEAAVTALGYTPPADGVLPPQIPFRDWGEGWDDWPPIFTPMYAPYQGTVASATVEIPLRVNRADYDALPVEELRRRAAVNTDIAAATIEATFHYVREHRRELIADQIEVFRRGAAGESQVVPPAGWVPGFGPEDVWTTEFPRAYVIPAGSGQRSAPAAARLVDHLIANDVQVRRASKSFTLGGTRYPAGSYLVDLHQPKRGMANVMLEAGRDITPDIEQMYDISGWSHGLLWGATVDPIPTGDLRRVVSRPVSTAAPTGEVAGGEADSGDLALRLDDGKEVAALNELLARGVAVSWTGDGTVVVPAGARAYAVELADRYGVQFRAAAGAGAPGAGVPGAVLSPVTVAAAAPADELFTLRELGFEVIPVSTSILNDGFEWSGVDVLFVASGLVYGGLNGAARAALAEFLGTEFLGTDGGTDGGTAGGVVTRGATGAAFNRDAGLLSVTAVAGRPDANGVVRVDGPGQTEHAFVYSPLWFTDLGPELTVEQRYHQQGPLVAGHWRARPDGTGGQDAAAGQAAVVSGVTDGGVPVVLFGTEPLFRNHPKGSFAQVARALYGITVSRTVISAATVPAG